MARFKKKSEDEREFLHPHKIITRPSYIRWDPQESQGEMDAHMYFLKFQEAVMINERIHGVLPKKPFEFDIVELHRSMGSYEETKKELDSRLRMFTRGPSYGVNLHIALYFWYLSKLLLMNPNIYEGTLDIAESMLRTSLEIVRTIDGEDHPNYATLLYELSDILQLRGQGNVAEKLVSRADTIMLQHE